MHPFSLIMKVPVRPVCPYQKPTLHILYYRIEHYKPATDLFIYPTTYCWEINLFYCCYLSITKGGLTHCKIGCTPQPRVG